MKTAQIIIPARLASTRLPRKLLLRETGKSLIRHTYEAARRSARAAGVCVATDHAEIFDEVRSFGGQVEMTDPAAPSGTDRVAEVARRMTGVDIIVNVQGDEPEIAGTSIDLAIELLEANPAAVMSTLATPIRSRRQLEDPACVKVVFDAAGRAMYFSRSVIPHPRQWDDALLDVRSADVLPARRALRLSPRFPAATGLDAAVPTGADREARTASRARRRPFDPRRRDRRAHLRHRHADDYRAFVEKQRRNEGTAVKIPHLGVTAGRTELSLFRLGPIVQPQDATTKPIADEKEICEHYIIKNDNKNLVSFDSGCYNNGHDAHARCDGTIRATYRAHRFLTTYYLNFGSGRASAEAVDRITCDSNQCKQEQNRL